MDNILQVSSWNWSSTLIQVVIHWPAYVPALPISALYKVYICTSDSAQNNFCSGFHMFATYMAWAALKGTEDG